MADETSRTPQQGGRPGGNREPGGFRIRLSDNEMRAARALQEAFHLRSTVAVLGFAVRTLGQMLEEGKLDELVAQHRSQAPAREGRGETLGRSGRPAEKAPRVDPFARPAKPAPTVTQADVPTDAEATSEADSEPPLPPGSEAEPSSTGTAEVVPDEPEATSPSEA